MKILGMEDNVNCINDIRKYVKKSKIYQINIPNKNKFLIEADNVDFFDSLDVPKQVNKINKIKSQFDLCIVSSWTTARIAYLAGLNYVYYFVGNDIRSPPFIKNSRPYYFKESVNKLNYLQRAFYMNVLKNALVCVASSPELYNLAKRYRDDTIRLDRVIVNTNLMNPNAIPIKKEKSKFTFFCPQRIGIEKGTDVLWKAISLCKSDFIVLQVEWFDETSDEAKKNSLEILKIKPPQVELIKKIKREEMPHYFSYADAILGQMQIGLLNNIERESSLCKRPVICFYDPNLKYFLDGKEVSAPYLPNSKDPIQIAKVIDQVVESAKFRERLVEDQYNFVKELGDPHKAAAEWDYIFEKLIKNSSKQKISKIRLKMRMFFFYLSHKVFCNKRIELP